MRCAVLVARILAGRWTSKLFQLRLVNKPPRWSALHFWLDRSSQNRTKPMHGKIDSLPQYFKTEGGKPPRRWRFPSPLSRPSRIRLYKPRWLGDLAGRFHVLCTSHGVHPTIRVSGGKEARLHGVFLPAPPDPQTLNRRMRHSCARTSPVEIDDTVERCRTTCRNRSMERRLDTAAPRTRHRRGRTATVVRSGPRGHTVGSWTP